MVGDVIQYRGMMRRAIAVDDEVDDARKSSVYGHGTPEITAAHVFSTHVTVARAKVALGYAAGGLPGSPALIQTDYGHLEALQLFGVRLASVQTEPRDGYHRTRAQFFPSSKEFDRLESLVEDERLHDADQSNVVG